MKTYTTQVQIVDENEESLPYLDVKFIYMNTKVCDK